MLLNTATIDHDSVTSRKINMTTALSMLSTVKILIVVRTLFNVECILISCSPFANVSKFIIQYGSIEYRKVKWEKYYMNIFKT